MALTRRFAAADERRLRVGAWRPSAFELLGCEPRRCRLDGTNTVSPLSRWLHNHEACRSIGNPRHLRAAAGRSDSGPEHPRAHKCLICRWQHRKRQDCPKREPVRSARRWRTLSQATSTPWAWLKRRCQHQSMCSGHSPSPTAKTLRWQLPAIPWAPTWFACAPRLRSRGRRRRPLQAGHRRRLRAIVDDTNRAILILLAEGFGIDETARREHIELIWQGPDRKIHGRNNCGNDQHRPAGWDFVQRGAPRRVVDH